MDLRNFSVNFLVIVNLKKGGGKLGEKQWVVMNFVVFRVCFKLIIIKIKIL